ncbi:MAG: hypothetical protein LBH20_11700 [Treponema sp.]|jgi:uncharacterized integral membrane protein|nr:hypothetical protein [Treponema sp.]
MPWRLIEFFIIFAIFFLFIVFNLGNKCDISFGITVMKDVPVFLTAFSSFFIGMICVLPLIFAFRVRKKAKTVRGKGLLVKASKKQGKNSSENPDENSADSSLSDKIHYGID